MAATYRGKLVINEGQDDPRCCTLSQDELDEKIAEGALWGSLGSLTGPYVRLLRNEDGTTVSEEDRIYVSEVPADADLFISAGEGYYIQN